ncbi:SnoaL-like domain protein [compost metagenome]
MEAVEVGKKLVELCNKGQHLKAVDTLYSDDIVSVEAEEMPGMPLEMKGIEAIRQKNVAWDKENETDKFEAQGPFAHGDSFAVHFKMSGKSKTTGKPFSGEEVGIYTVKDGKIVREEFFYTM